MSKKKKTRNDNLWKGNNKTQNICEFVYGYWVNIYKWNTKMQLVLLNLKEPKSLDVGMACVFLKGSQGSYWVGSTFIT